MLTIQIICVGKLKERFYEEAVAEYTKRLSSYCKLTITELSEERLPENPAQAQIDAALQKEGAAILERIPKGAVTIAMCVEGRLQSSEDLAERISGWMLGGRSTLVFLVGGSHGLSKDVKGKSLLRVSMSPMTFPHHLARVMLLEQIYRAFKINEGSGYHK
ncbi:MAG: 23S rRNA (pseudouridine(1915)-N(3))-methyltransferase RlmH [Clostridia bacterium]|nr:23S rRNA (pseudouridine(1915)-N(3))-methyltransferase RlmH [Clostridia bacterium]